MSHTSPTQLNHQSKMLEHKIELIELMARSLKGPSLYTLAGYVCSLWPVSCPNMQIFILKKDSSQELHVY